MNSSDISKTLFLGLEIAGRVPRATSPDVAHWLGVHGRQPDQCDPPGFADAAGDGPGRNPTQSLSGIPAGRLGLGAGRGDDRGAQSLRPGS